jgi:Fe-S-cluster-containing hydrogenase component 2
MTITTIPPNIRSASNCTHDFDDDHLVVKDKAWHIINDQRDRSRKAMADIEHALSYQLEGWCSSLGSGHPWGPWHSRPWTAIDHSDQQQWSRTCLRCGARQASDRCIEGAIEHVPIPSMGGWP